eukprot:gene2072-5131_t
MVLSVQTWAIEDATQAKALVDALVFDNGNVEIARLIRDAITVLNLLKHHEDLEPELISMLVSIIDILFPKLDNEEQQEIASLMFKSSFHLCNVACDQALQVTALSTFEILFKHNCNCDEFSIVTRLIPFLVEQINNTDTKLTASAAADVLIQLCKCSAVRSNEMIANALVKQLSSIGRTPRVIPLYFLNAIRAVLLLDIEIDRLDCIFRLLDPIIPYIHHPQPSIRIAAIGCVLARPCKMISTEIYKKLTIHNHQILPNLIGLLRNGIACDIRGLALHYLGQLLNRDDYEQIIGEYDLLTPIKHVLTSPSSDSDPTLLTSGALFVLAAVAAYSEDLCISAINKGLTAHLPDFLASSYTDIRRAAATAARKITRSLGAVKSNAINSSVLTNICKLLVDENSSIRREAVATFANICIGCATPIFEQIESSVWSRIHHLLHEDDEETRYSAFIVCQKALEDLDVQYLLHVYQQDSNIAVRQAAAGIFKNLGCHKELIEAVAENCISTSKFLEIFLPQIVEPAPPEIEIETDFRFATVLRSSHPNVIHALIHRLVESGWNTAHKIKIAAACALRNIIDACKRQDCLVEFADEFRLQSTLDEVNDDDIEVNMYVDDLKTRIRH